MMERRYDNRKMEKVLVKEDTDVSRWYDKNEIAGGQVEHRKKSVRQDLLGDGWEEVSCEVETGFNGQQRVVFKRAKYEYR